MVDKKTAAILALLILLVISGGGWYVAEQKPPPENIPPEKIPYDNTYMWTEYFGGYEAYLDKRIYYGTMGTSSMVPTINVGDTILWVEVDNIAGLEVGDIIIFKHPTYPDVDNIAHRIVEIVPVDGGYQFVTKGDNLSEQDQHPVPEGNVHGLVIGVVYPKSSG